MSAFFIMVADSSDGAFQPSKAIKLSDGRVVVVERGPIITYCPEMAKDVAKHWAKEEGLNYKEVSSNV